MGIVQIGARLIRSFGSGENLRKIVTETVNGKTFTRVLDKDGKIVKERVKQIVRNQQVGNKKVNTVTKVTEGSKEYIGHPYDYTEKLIYDRVYNKDGEFLGSRAVFRDPYYKTAVLKNHVGGNSFLKNFPNTASGFRVVKKQIGVPAGEAPIDEMCGVTRVYYNNKGLPMPQWSGTGNDFRGMSLKAMKDRHLKKHPELPYAPEGMGLDFLNNRTEGLAAMNDLDKFI